MEFNPISNFDRFSVEMEKLNVFSRKVFPRISFLKETYSKYEDCVGDIIYELKAEVIAEVLKPIENSEYTLCIEIPNSWWQAFKETYFNDFLLKRFPIRRKKIIKVLQARVLQVYPQCPEHLCWANENITKLSLISKKCSKEIDKVYGTCIVKFEEK